MSSIFKKVLTTGIIFVLLSGTAIMAVDLTATEITKTEGRVEVKKIADALFKKLHSNLRLAGSLKRLDGGDKVRTYDKSSAEMALKDTCILGVKEQSIFEVPKTLGQAAVTELKAQQGAILFKVVSGSNFEVQTADVIAGVKGTLFEVDIIDNFHSLLETPGLQIGSLAAGGTTINVYKGEVELTHKQTGKKRTLKQGEGLAALGSTLRNLDKVLQDGFTPLRKFDPANLLSQKFGGATLGLLNTDASVTGLSQLTGLGDINSSLGTNRITNMFGDLSSKIEGLSQISGAAGDIIDQAKDLEQLGKDLSGAKYKADFSRYSQEKRPFSVTDRNIKESYLGNRTFAASKAVSGSSRARLEPNQEGLQLVEGSCNFKVVQFDNAKKHLEFVASHYQSGDKLVTNVQVIKGKLFGRIPGDLEHFEVPAGQMSFVYDTATGKGQWLKAAAGVLPQDMSNHIFRAEQQIAKDKGNHEHQDKKKKVDAVKKLINIKPGKLFKW